MPAREARTVRPVRRVMLLALLGTVISVIASWMSGQPLAIVVQTAVFMFVGSLFFGGLAYHREIADVIRARRQG